LAAEWHREGASPASSKPGSPGNAFAKLLIPKLGLDTIVVEGTTAKALQSGPGHLVHSARFGSAGNTVIAGHRDTFFRNLNLLAPGDSIIADDGSQRYRYTVTSAKVVSPEDTSVLAASEEARLTLITCYPMHYIGPAPKRLVVVAALDRGSAAPETRPGQNATVDSNLRAGFDSHAH
jgi:sortase A